MTVLGLLSSVADQIKAPKGLWELLLRLLSGAIPTYVWAIIVFTILLKIVLSPLDFFQKYKMKKNERLTKKLQPEMDKLARQYEGDKATLQQKQFQLQKASGFSYFSACIPMILTMVVFFTFYAGMRNISQYEEFTQYVNRYDIYVTRYADLTGLNLDGTAVLDSNEAASNEAEIRVPVDFDELIAAWGEDLSDEDTAALNSYAAYKSHADFKAFYANYLERAQKRNLVSANNILQVSDDHTDTPSFKNEGSKVYNPTAIYSFDSNTASASEKAEFDKVLPRFLSGLKSNIDNCDAGGIMGQINTINDFKALIDELNYYDNLTRTYVPMILSVAESYAANEVYQDYKNKKPGFLWIKSIWVADVPWKQAISGYSTFRSSVSSYMVNNKGGLDDAVFNEIQKQETYEKVMAKVLDDKSLSGTNGYLILAFLAVALSFLSQFITTRQQKKSGTTTTSNTSFKMMMYIMPLMIGAFALFSTAAFTIYMIINSLMTLLINLLTSFIIGKIFKKESVEGVNAEGIIKYGRKDPNDNIKK